MTEPDDLPQRVDALETQGRQQREEIATARSDAAAARMLAAAADRDVSEVRAELRAHTASLNALRETQIEQGRVLDGHTQVLNRHTQILGGHTQTLNLHSQILGECTQILGEHGRMLGTVQAGVAHIVELLTERRGAT